MDQNTKRDDFNQKDAALKTYTFTQKQLLIAGGCVLLVIATLLIWKSVQTASLEKAYSQREKEMQAQFANRYAEQTAAYLKSLAKPYVWALRTEVMQGNIGQVNQYNNDMVKQRNFQSVMVADTKGLIISSTDKKYEGKNLSALQMDNYLQTDSTVVTKTADSLLLMASPIMSFNSKLGILLIRYAPKLPGGF